MISPTTDIDVSAMRERLRKFDAKLDRYANGSELAAEIRYDLEDLELDALLSALDRAEKDRDDFAEQIAAYRKGEKYFEQQAVMGRENALLDAVTVAERALEIAAAYLKGQDHRDEASICEGCAVLHDVHFALAILKDTNPIKDPSKLRAAIAKARGGVG